MKKIIKTDKSQSIFKNFFLNFQQRFEFSIQKNEPIELSMASPITSIFYRKKTLLKIINLLVEIYNPSLFKLKPNLRKSLTKIDKH